MLDMAITAPSKASRPCPWVSSDEPQAVSTTLFLVLAQVVVARLAAILQGVPRHEDLKGWGQIGAHYEHETALPSLGVSRDLAAGAGDRSATPQRLDGRRVVLDRPDKRRESPSRGAHLSPGPSSRRQVARRRGLSTWRSGQSPTAKGRGRLAWICAVTHFFGFSVHRLRALAACGVGDRELGATMWLSESVQWDCGSSSTGRPARIKTCVNPRASDDACP